MKVQVSIDRFPFATQFRISRGARSVAEVVRVQIEADRICAQGECVPYARYAESPASVCAQIESVGAIDRVALQEALPPGAARNALDCALWDLQAKQTGQPVWQLAGLAPPQPQITAYTLSLDTPEKMAEAAQKHAHRPLLKVKLGTADDLARIEAVRRGAPHSKIIVDANEGWTAQVYADLAPHLVRLGVLMVEQPLPAGEDEALNELERVLPVCADESCHDRSSLAHLAGRYDMVNIKLDKTGGLTEALALRDAALQQGYAIMVGCMVGSSLAMAPALLVAQNAAITDLDGPLLLAEDRACPLLFDSAGVHPPTPELWG